MVLRGRTLDESDLGMIHDPLDAHPDWHRTQLNRELRAPVGAADCLAGGDR